MATGVCREPAARESVYVVSGDASREAITSSQYRLRKPGRTVAAHLEDELRSRYRHDLREDPGEDFHIGNLREGHADVKGS